VAHNGQQGIDAIAAETPDLIILDLMMPVLDGFAVVEYLDQKPELRAIPVVVVTAKDLSSDDRAMLRGARAILQRTAYSRRELIDAIAERVTELTRLQP
jgi:CheY-like chemotaxis protein